MPTASLPTTRSLKRDKGALLRLNAAMCLSQELFDRLTLDPKDESSAEQLARALLNRIQHTTVLLGALLMLALAIICCWPSGHDVSWVTLIVVALSLIGTAGFGYFFYDERAFK
jgi:hypothetical protein